MPRFERQIVVFGGRHYSEKVIFSGRQSIRRGNAGSLQEGIQLQPFVFGCIILDIFFGVYPLDAFSYIVGGQ